MRFLIKNHALLVTSIVLFDRFLGFVLVSNLRMSKLPVALVTGATRGIGRAIVDKLADKGVSCLMIGSQMTSFDRMRKRPPKIRNKHQWHRALAIDLGKWPQWTEQDVYTGVHFNGSMHEQLYAQEANQWSLFDIPDTHDIALLVNCAGITQASPALRCSPEDILRITNINYMSAVTLCSLSAKKMLRSRKHLATPPCIINVSSILGDPKTPPLPGTALYSASKAALTQYSRVLSEELARSGIQVHSLSPSLVSDTDMIRTLEDTVKKRLQHHLGNLTIQKPRDIAEQVWQLYQGSKDH